jgi:hypothetical protein
LVITGLGAGVAGTICASFIPPMTGKEWFVIRSKNKRIIGVRSTSSRTPFRKEGFDQGFEDFATAKTYQDWEFFHPFALCARPFYRRLPPLLHQWARLEEIGVDNPRSADLVLFV